MFCFVSGVLWNAGVKLDILVGLMNSEFYKVACDFGKCFLMVGMMV